MVSTSYSRSGPSDTRIASPPRIEVRSAYRVKVGSGSRPWSPADGHQEQRLDELVGAVAGQHAVRRQPANSARGGGQRVGIELG
jgi:hypothetical protein